MKHKILPKKYDYQYDETLLDFDEEPNPPGDYTPSMQWDHSKWNKKYDGMVLLQELRDSISDCQGVFPNFFCPYELLDYQKFRKFCYLADDEKNGWNGKGEFCPTNYLPYNYRNDPDEWEERQRGTRENRRQFNKRFGNSLSKLLGRDSAEEEDDDEEETEEIIPLFVDDNGQVVSTNDNVRFASSDDGDIPETLTDMIGTVLYRFRNKNEKGEYEDRFAVRIEEIQEEGEDPIGFRLHHLHKVVPRSADKGEKPCINVDEKKIVARRAKKQKKTADDDVDDTSRKKSEEENDTALLDLDSLSTRNIVSTYLNPIDHRHLRLTCKETWNNWPKPLSDAVYDFIYFQIHNPRNVYQGIAYTMNDVVSEWRHYNKGDAEGQYDMSFKFVKFERRHPIAPLMTFKMIQNYWEITTAKLDDIGCHYFGVESPIPLEPLRDDEYTRYTFGYEMEDLIPFLDWFDGLQPREPRVNLHHFGLKKRNDNDEEVGILYYSPAWFGNAEQSYIKSSETYVIFEEEIRTVNY